MLLAEHNHLSERERVGMCDRELRGCAADFLEAPPGAAVQLQLRRTAGPANDFDVAPEHALRVAGAQGFHRGFLRGKPAGKMNFRMAAAHAVRDFAVREDALRESFAVALDGRGDARNLRSVKPEPDNGHASQA